jgi:hypothetical protein
LQRSSRTATPANRKPQPNHKAGSGQNYDRVWFFLMTWPSSRDLRIIPPECIAKGFRFTLGVLKLGRVRSTPLSCSQPSATLQPLHEDSWLRSACQSGLFWRCHTLRDLVSRGRNGFR